MARKAPYAAFAQRLYMAQKRYELKSGRDLDRDDFGRDVARRSGRDKALSDSTVSNWFTGKQMPAVKQLEAIAAVLGVHPGWLTFGEETEVMTPDGPESLAGSTPAAPKRRRQGPLGQK